MHRLALLGAFPALALSCAATAAPNDFGPEIPGLVLDFPASKQVVRELDDGAKELVAQGTIKNTTKVTKTVPPILLLIRGPHEILVWREEIAPLVKTIRPGEVICIRRFIGVFPMSGQILEIGWIPEAKPTT